MDIFDDDNLTKKSIQKAKPLAERMRPKILDEVIGQSHLIGNGSPLRIFFESEKFPSMILWGPPGVGKTTFAQLVAEISGYMFFQLSAIDSGVKEVRAIILQAENQIKKGNRCLLFIDEIHRFNKSQQDALLKAVEKGIVTLIGATTENPSFEVNSALLSRCQIYNLKPLNDEELRNIITNATLNDIILKQLDIKIEDINFLIKYSNGDARSALNALELAINLFPNQTKITLTNEDFEKALQQKNLLYDKNGESHYDTISAFIKSMRGSDPDAALLWLAKMLEAGEDPKFIARRMVIFASEDIGNADPFALTLAVSVFQAVQMIGLPECRINLSQGVTYLAACAKSNAAYVAITEAMKDIKNGTDLSVPLHLRNAPTNYMKSENYGKDYQYPHNFENNFIQQNYFPANAEKKVYYKPTNAGKEKIFLERLKFFWNKIKKYDR
jgi:putative ATPase